MSSAITIRQIQQIRTSEEHLITRTGIHLAARVAQTVLAPACIWSVVDITFRLLQILIGGSVVSNGARIMSQVVRIVAFHDLAKISSNIASIFKSTVLIQFMKNHALFHNSYGKKMVQFLEDCDTEFVLPDQMLKNLKNGKNVAEALTYGTIAFHHLNPYIAEQIKS